MIEHIPNILLQDAAITGLVQNRIKPEGSNQGDVFPYITFQSISDVPTRCREGIAVETVRVQVNAYDVSYGKVQALYQAIRAALDNSQSDILHCQWLSAQDLYRETGDAHGKAIDFQLITK
jgi:hypothetical protein